MLIFDVIHKAKVTGSILIGLRCLLLIEQASVSRNSNILFENEELFRIFAFYTCFRTSISQIPFRLLYVAHFRTSAFSHFALYTCPAMAPFPWPILKQKCPHGTSSTSNLVPSALALHTILNMPLMMRLNASPGGWAHDRRRLEQSEQPEQHLVTPVTFTLLTDFHPVSCVISV